MLSLKAGGKTYFLPPVIVLVLVPVLCRRFIIYYGGSPEGYIGASNMMQQLIPLLAVWWIMILTQEIIDGPGREVYLFCDPGCRKTLRQCAVIFLWYLVHIAVAMLLVCTVMPSVGWIFLELALQSLFFVGFYLLIGALLRKTGAALLLLMLYYVVMAYMDQTTKPWLKAINVYNLGEIANAHILRTHSVWVGAVGFVMAILGWWLLRHPIMHSSSNV